jgi:Transposase IS66 family
LVVQDLVLHAEVVRFRREKWYAKSTGKTYLAPLPLGYAGHFGPGGKTLALTLYHVTGVSEPKIRELLASVGLAVAASTLSDWLTQEQEPFHAAAQAVYMAGLASSPWQQIDDTATRVHGQAEHCHVVGNPLYAS